MRVTMIGAGYVGLVSGACFAAFGHDVICVDQDNAKIECLNQGLIPIYEPGLEALVAANRAGKRLHFSNDLAGSVAQAELVFIAVGTPSRRGDGHADLSYVYEAACEVAKAIKGNAVIVTKSTVPVGTGDEIERIMRETNPQASFAVVSNPEFLREGAAIQDFKHPDRIVVGTDDPNARQLMRAVYHPALADGAVMVEMSRRGAELAKYASNAFLATKITFINEIADLCEQVGADARDVAYAMGLDPRIGPKFLNAGPGYGGSCFPKDTVALLKTAEDFETPLRIVEAVAAVNHSRKRAMGRRILNALGDSPRGHSVAILGLTFKPETDDMRDAPSLAIITALQDHGLRIRAYDPQGIGQAQELLSDVDYFENPYEACEGADAAVIVTEWTVLRALDLVQVRARLARPIFVDLRNIYAPEMVVKAGLAYHGIGRPSRFPPRLAVAA